MKKYILFLVIGFLSLSMRADGPSDLVIIINPSTQPGNEVSVDLDIVFYDANGKKINLEYTYDPITNKVTIKGGNGVVFMTVTNKKTNESKTSKIVFVTWG